MKFEIGKTYIFRNLRTEESNDFQKIASFEDAIKLRKFDEIAKKTNIKMKSIYDYKDLLPSKLL